MSEVDKTIRKPKEASIFNIPNSLTVVRLVLVPVFIYLMTIDSNAGRWAAFIVFVVAAMTDQLDGFLARRWNLITNFGKMADPIADKALTLSAMIMLSLLGLLPWYVTVVILVRELGITLMRFIVINQVVIAASWSGKIKTVVQMLFLGGMLLPFNTFLPVPGAVFMYNLSWWLAIVAMIITIYSGLQYVWAQFGPHKTLSS